MNDKTSNILNRSVLFEADFGRTTNGASYNHTLFNFSCWQPLGDNNSLNLGVTVTISSPLEALDAVRTNERFDFQTNGILMELDELDWYQTKLRSAQIPESEHTGNEWSKVINEEIRRRRKEKPPKNTVCVFCKNNGEALSLYGNHVLKDCNGRVTCPVLRRYTCPICGAYGDRAHTIKYCPRNVYPFNTISLQRTPKNSNGRNRCS